MNTKKMAMFFTCVVCIFALVSCRLQEDDISVIRISYEEFRELNYMENIEAVSYFYLGRETCPDCMEFNSDLDKWASEMNIKLLYYDATELFVTDRNIYDALKAQYAIEGVPTVLAVVNGEVVRVFTGSTIKREMEVFISTL